MKEICNKDFKAMQGDARWFVHDRFGMFIHWGLYSQGARHEWLMNNEKIPVEEYERRYFKRFDPDLYNPEEWAQLAENAGMKYFVITTKHHEGFCLWDSKFTDYKATRTPAGRDLLKPMLSAFRERGLRTGLYYSLIDWHHPQFVLDPHLGPYRDHPDRETMNQGRKQAEYAKYLHNQVRELLTKYGKIDVMWFDFSYPKPDGSGKGHEDWQSDKLLKMIRDLAPEILLDDRLDIPYGWDIKTPEQFQPREGVKIGGKPVVWEACQTLSGSWGYHRDEASWRDTDELIRTLIDCVSKDGNLLLNIGPTGRGEIDARAQDRLRGIGEWMRRHSRAIYGCGPAPAGFQPPENCRLTYNAEKKRIYLHIFAWPYKHIHLDGPAFRNIEYAQLLHDSSEVMLKGVEEWQLHAPGAPSADSMAITLPQTRPDVSIPVVEFFLK